MVEHEAQDILPSFSLGRLRELFPSERSWSMGDDFMLFERASADGDGGKRLFGDPCRIDALGVIFCTEGRICGSINLKEYEATAGMAAVCMPGNILRIDHDDDFVLRGMLISADFLRSLRVDVNLVMPLWLRIRDGACFRLRTEDVALLDRFYFLLREVTVRRGTHTSEIAGGLVTAMAHAFCDMLAEGVVVAGDLGRAQGRQGALFEQFMTLLGRYHTTERSLKFYAAQLCITPKYLSSAVKEASGRTAVEWVDDFVVLEAKTLLKFSGLSIQEVAWRLNFPSQSFFGKYFKHRTGLSPSEYKIL